MSEACGSKKPFRAEQRLRRRREYEQVYRARQRIDARLFVIHFRSNNLECDRLGLSVSKRLGNAVTRNRAKRLLRELFRRHQPAGSPAADLVVSPGSQALEANWKELRRCWLDSAERIRRSLRRRNL